MKRVIFSVLLLSLVLAGCATPAAEPTTVKLPMGYIPNIQFAPFYVALEKGYFSEEGITLEFDYAFETDGIALVGAGNTPFSLASGEQVLLARAQGLPVTYVYGWYKEFPVALVTTDPDIQTAADLKGKQIGLPGLYGATYIGLRALLSSATLQESDVVLNSIGYTQIEALSSGAEQSIMGYSTNEPIVLAAQGVPFTTIHVGDVVQLASNGIITNEQTMQQNPTLVRGFIRAFNRGLADTVADPSAAYEISKKYVEGLAEADAQIQMGILRSSIQSWNTEMMGASDGNSWENMQTVLLEMGMLAEPQDLASAFTNSFLEK